MKRLKYYLEKIFIASKKGVLLEKLYLFIGNKYMQYFFAPIQYLRNKKNINKLKIDDEIGFKDHLNDVDFLSIKDEDIYRIIQSYNLAKRNYINAPSQLEVRGLWDEWISVNFCELIAALNEKDVNKLRYLFNNIMRMQFTVGLGPYDEWNRSKRLFGKEYIKYVWFDYYNKLKKLDPNLEPKFPLVGNPSGLFYNKTVIPYEALRHAYRAKEISDILSDCSEKDIVEIGGGYGGLAFQLASSMPTGNFRFRLYDIPEVAAISSAFLLTSLSNCNVSLYGEDVDLNNEAPQICIYPHFAICDIKDNSIDLFYNSCSFSEMDGASANYYLKVIERASRNYFMHDNHDTKFSFIESNGKVSENIIGSELIPDINKFRLVYKKTRTHGLPEDKSFVHHEFLYKKFA
jgi:putative sugar O-methyltransferase